MIWDAAPTGKRGRQQTYSDTAIQTCLTMKVLFGMALRQTTGFVESLLRLIGLNWAAPDFSTLSRRQKTLAVNIPYRGSNGPLHLLIPSHRRKRRLPGSGCTGIKVEGEGEWNARKHPSRALLRNTLPGSGRAQAAGLAQNPPRDRRGNAGGSGRPLPTGDCMAISEREITGSHIGPSCLMDCSAIACRAVDAPILPDLPSQIPADEQIGSVTTDGAYDTRKCHDAIHCPAVHVHMRERS